MRTTLPHPREQGYILLFAILLMTATIAFGVAFAAASQTRASAQGRAENRLQARAAAEGGLELAYRRLIDNPSFRGAETTTIGGAVSSYTISDSGVNQVDIEVVGVFEDFQSAMESRATLEVTQLLAGTVGAGTHVRIEEGTFSWTGTILYRNVLEAQKGGILDGGDSRQIDSFGFTLDMPAFLATATQVLPDKSELTEGTHSGIIYAEGDLTVQGPNVTINGTLIADGKLTIDGGNGNIVIDQGTQSSALVAFGNIEVQNAHQVEISGLLLAGGHMSVTSVEQLTVRGALMADKHLETDKSNVDWIYESDRITTIPSQVSGLPTEDVADPPTELWRRPIPIAAADADPPGADPPGADPPGADPPGADPPTNGTTQASEVAPR